MFVAFVKERETADMGRIRPVAVVNNYMGPRCLLSRSEAYDIPAFETRPSSETCSILNEN